MSELRGMIPGSYNDYCVCMYCTPLNLQIIIVIGSGFLIQSIPKLAITIETLLYLVMGELRLDLDEISSY